MICINSIFYTRRSCNKIKFFKFMQLCITFMKFNNICYDSHLIICLNYLFIIIVDHVGAFLLKIANR